MKKRGAKNTIQAGAILTALALSGIAHAKDAAGIKTAALPVRSQALKPGGQAKPLKAWAEFCHSLPAECAVNTSEPERIVLTPAVWERINKVNRTVNAQVKAITDQDHWGVLDRWDYPDDGKGDCEDIQLLKRKRLAEAGLPRRAMRMTVVIDELGEGHAVLAILTDKGDFILDNKTSAVLSWHETGYTYIKRESTEEVAWLSLGGVVSPPLVTANK